jgi:hypothetical protein
LPEQIVVTFKVPTRTRSKPFSAHILLPKLDFLILVYLPSKQGREHLLKGKADAAGPFPSNQSSKKILE